MKAGEAWSNSTETELKMRSYLHYLWALWTGTII